MAQAIDRFVIGGQGRYPYNRGKHLIVAAELWVYSDESADGRDEAYCVVAGFIANPRQWDKFNRAWAQVITKAEITEFHAVDFFNRHQCGANDKNEFSLWSEEKAKDFLAGLLDVITKHKHVRPIGAVLDTKAFLEYSWGERMFLNGALWNNRAKKFVGSHMRPRVTYNVPFFSLVGDAAHRAIPSNSRVHFRIDEKAVLEFGLQRLWSHLRKDERLEERLRDRIGDLLPGQSQDHPGIQAADLLARVWCSIWLLRERLSGERREAATAIWQTWQEEPGMVTTRGLDILLDGLADEDRLLVRNFPSPGERQKAKREAKS